MSTHREIRSERALLSQGLRAGFFSRAVASGIDVALVVCVYVFGFLVVSIAWDLLFSVSLSVPPHWVNALTMWILLVTYLTASWGTAGRTLGKQLLGLRVRRSDGSRLRIRRAFLRAVLCATLFVVLLFALVSRRNRGLEDIIFGTVVAYEWFPEEPEPVEVGTSDAHLEFEVREVSLPLPP